jgi:ABC-type sugar transport system ATPase subunit
MGGTRLPLDLAAGHDNYRSLDGKQVIVGIRPGDLTPAQDNGPAIAARVEIVERLGGENMVVFPSQRPKCVPTNSDRPPRMLTTTSRRDPLTKVHLRLNWMAVFVHRPATFCDWR